MTIALPLVPTKPHRRNVAPPLSPPNSSTLRAHRYNFAACHCRPPLSPPPKSYNRGRMFGRTSYAHSLTHIPWGFLGKGLNRIELGKSFFQMPEEELLELKLCLYDGSDIGHFRYPSASTVAMHKDRIIVERPKGQMNQIQSEGEFKLAETQNDLQEQQQQQQQQQHGHWSKGKLIWKHIYENLH